MRRILGLVLVVALTIVASLAESYRNALWISYRDYVSPYLSDLPAGPPRTPVSNHIVLVLVRGLRLDDSRQMPALNGLRARGIDMVVQHQAPTYRLAAWASLFSGARVEINGVTTNYTPRSSSASSIFSEMQSAGEPVAIIGSQALGDMYGSATQRFESIENSDVAHRDDDAVRVALDMLKDAANPVRLLCVEFTAIEENAHNGSNDTAATLSATDARIQTLSDGLNLNNSTLIILSDRGLNRQGLDGGEEPDIALTPLIMAGAGIAPARPTTIDIIDIAPTLAVLAGAPMPVHAQGQPDITVLALSSVPTPTATGTITTGSIVSPTLAPLPGALWSSALQLTTFYEGFSEAIRQPRFATELLRARQEAIRTGDTNAYEKLHADLNTHAENAIATRLSTERAQRLPLLIGIGILVIALLGVCLSSWRWQPILGAILYAATWYALFTFTRQHQYSLSMFPDSDPTLFFTALARDAAVLIVGISVIIAVTTRGHEDGLDAVATVMVQLLLIVLIQVVQTAWFYFQWGDRYSWNLPDSPALVSALVALTQASALSIRIVPELPNLPLPLLIAMVTLLVFSLVRRREQHQGYGRLR